MVACGRQAGRQVGRTRRSRAAAGCRGGWQRGAQCQQARPSPLHPLPCRARLQSSSPSACRWDSNPRPRAPTACSARRRQEPPKSAAPPLPPGAARGPARRRAEHMQKCAIGLICCLHFGRRRSKGATSVVPDTTPTSPLGVAISSVQACRFSGLQTQMACRELRDAARGPDRQRMPGAPSSTGNVGAGLGV